MIDLKMIGDYQQNTNNKFNFSCMYDAIRGLHLVNF